MSFVDPALLWGLAVVPLLVAGYVLIQRRRRAYTVRFTNLELLAAVAPRRPGWRRHVAPALFLLTLIVLIGALARPTVPVLVPREQASVVLVIDVSRSMSAADLQPDRITAAKVAATDFLGILPRNLRVGVVAFSDSANLISGLTRDRNQSRQAIDRLEPLAGTAMGEGLAAALGEIERLREQGQEEIPASVLLLSDGQSNRGRPPEMIAMQARAMKVPVFTVGIGTVGATLEFAGRIVRVDLNEEELKGVAEATNGAYFESSSAGSLREVYRKLGSSLGFEKEPREVSSWAAGLAALLLLAGAAASLLWFQRIP